MGDWLQRERALIGSSGVDRLSGSTVAIVGLGGVGGAAAEAVVRAGVGRVILVDFDRVAETDKNRQLLATDSAMGEYKTDTAEKRYLDINSSLTVVKMTAWLDENTVGPLFDLKPDFVIDAIDKVTYKLLLIEHAAKNGVRIISSMGTGKRIDPAGFKIGTAADTAGCGDGLARVMRHELSRRGMLDTPVLYSITPPADTDRTVIASISFVPPVAGYMLGGYCVRTLLGE